MASEGTDTGYETVTLYQGTSGEGWVTGPRLHSCWTEQQFVPVAALDEAVKVGQRLASALETIAVGFHPDLERAVAQARSDLARLSSLVEEGENR